MDSDKIGMGLTGILFICFGVGCFVCQNYGWASCAFLTAGFFIGLMATE